MEKAKRELCGNIVKMVELKNSRMGQYRCSLVTEQTCTVERPHELVCRLTDTVEGLAGVEKKLTEAAENLGAEIKLLDEVTLCE